MSVIVVGTLVVPMLADSQLIRVSPIPSGVVGQPIVFTSQ